MGSPARRTWVWLFWRVFPLFGLVQKESHHVGGSGSYKKTAPISFAKDLSALSVCNLGVLSLFFPDQKETPGM